MTPENEEKLLEMVRELVLRVRRIDSQLKEDDERRKRTARDMQDTVNQIRDLQDSIKPAT